MIRIPTFIWHIENRHFDDGDFNSYLPSAFPSYVSDQGLLVWRMDNLNDNFPVLIPADNDFHEAPGGTDSQGDHGDFFPGESDNLLFAPTTIPSSTPSDDDVAFEIKSDNGTSFTVDFYSSNAPNPPPDAPSNLQITNAGQNGQNIELGWDDNNTEPDFDHYAIYRGYQDGAGPIYWGGVVATTSNTYWTDPTFEIDTSSSEKVHYRITAVDEADNESDYSNTVNSGTNDIPIPKRGTETIVLPQRNRITAKLPQPLQR